MTWVVVPNLLEARDQLNKRFPDRDKRSEGTIGDAAHQGSASSHNPDITGTPEYRDHDGKNEVRAADFDKDLRDVHGVSMERVVQLWVKLARSNVLWWVRYIIYNGRIWHRRDGFTTRVYTGNNKHTDHVHVNSDFTQKADEIRGTNWHLANFGLPVVTPKPSPPKYPIYKSGSSGAMIKYIQQFLRHAFPAYRNDSTVRRGALITVDGDYGPQTEAWVKVFQKRTGLEQDGVVGPLTLNKLRKYGFGH